MANVNSAVFTYDYHQKWNFAVEVDGYDRAFFTTIDRPKVSTDIVEIGPGGSHRNIKMPGRLVFDDLTAERGVLITNDPDFVGWMNDIQEFQEGGGSAAIADLLKTVDIVEYDTQGQEVNRWRLYGAWISGYDGGDLDGSASEVVTESLTFTYQYFKHNP